MRYIAIPPLRQPAFEVPMIRFPSGPMLIVALALAALPAAAQEKKTLVISMWAVSYTHLTLPTNREV